VLSGVVIAEEALVEPAKIVIEQVTEPAAVRSAWVTWRELARIPTFRPFDLALDSGERVRVEPDPDTRIEGELVLASGVDWEPLSTRAKQAAVTRRQKIVTVRDGQRVHLIGALRASIAAPTKLSAFRGRLSKERPEETPPARALVVRSHPFEPLLICTRRLDRDRLPRVALHALALISFLALAVTMHASVLAPYYLLAFSGRPVWATTLEIVEDPWTRSARDRYALRVSYEIDGRREVKTLEPVDATLLELALESDADGRPRPIAVLVSEDKRGRRLVSIGLRPRVSGFTLIYLLGALIAAEVYFFAARQLSPWFERKRLNEREAAPTQN